MDQRLEDFIDRTEAATSAEEIKVCLKRSLAGLGAEDFSLSEHRAGGELVGFVWDEIGNGFADAYRDQDWGRVDPIVRRAGAVTKAFAWSSSEADAAMGDAERRYLKDINALGLKIGIMSPFHRPGGRFDVIAVCFREDGAIDPSFLRRAHALALQSWTRWNDLEPHPVMGAPVLTNRELECLKWLKDGKTNWEISQILSVSEKTVEFHVANLMRKLHADSRLAAVIFALRLGIVTL